MTRVRYDTTVPEKYWPDSERPWRVSWGLGAFADFKTEEEARAKAEGLRRDLSADWPATVRDPYDAVKQWGRVDARA